MYRTTKILTVLTIVGIATVGLSACSTEAASPGKTTESGNVTADKPAETTTPSPAAVDTNAKFGQTVTYEDLDLSVSTPEPFTPSEYAASGTQPNNVVFTITVKNTSDENFDPSLIYITASSAGTEAESIFDSESGITGNPSTAVPAGQTITWKQAFNVANPGNIILEANPGMFEYKAAVFTN